MKKPGKPGLTPEVDKIYQEIRSRMPAQRDNYAQYVSSLSDSYKSSLISQARDCGLRLDIDSGRLYYSPDFEPVEVKYEVGYVRHGKTEGNTEPRIYQGCVDYEDNQLNGIGLGQALDAAKKMEDLTAATGWKPQLIVCSPLKRALATSAPYAKAHPEIPVMTVEATKEMAFGDWDDVQVKDVPWDSIGHLFYLEQNAVVKSDKPHINKADGTPIPAECFVEVLTRVKAALLELNSKIPSMMPAGSKVLFFGHSMAGAAVSILLGHGKAEAGSGALGFDGSFIMPNATPVTLPRKKPESESA
eukprot:GHVU01140705.1.p1 GENE.GHVU01140705.1~~GHVU01140705.1.p1  ORF type:complete len:318 (-),score=40.34 GHVU01140705.1:776-1681(-)